MNKDLLSHTKESFNFFEFIIFRSSLSLLSFFPKQQIGWKQTHSVNVCDCE